MSPSGLKCTKYYKQLQKFDTKLHTSFVTLQIVKSERLKGLNINELFLIFWFINAPLKLKIGRNCAQINSPYEGKKF